ncbi:hypothetical protein MUBE_10405 [Mycobacterium uberis]|uniref:PPE family domain-containing protein n=2 Tax=Mycobacterium uberis TaxID=2162698 RepID=A0A3E1HFL5_9MYCO|nr:hypothetical protein MUBE_10405 [Mycobacterium uberis]
MWNAVTEEMYPLIESFTQVFEGLEERCSDPSAMQMVEAARTFLSWLFKLQNQLDVPLKEIAYLGTEYPKYASYDVVLASDRHKPHSGTETVSEQRVQATCHRKRKS